MNAHLIAWGTTNVAVLTAWLLGFIGTAPAVTTWAVLLLGGGLLDTWVSTIRRRDGYLQGVLTISQAVRQNDIELSTYDEHIIDMASTDQFWTAHDEERFWALVRSLEPTGELR